MRHLKLVGSVLLASTIFTAGCGSAKLKKAKKEAAAANAKSEAKPRVVDDYSQSLGNGGLDVSADGRFTLNADIGRSTVFLADLQEERSVSLELEGRRRLGRALLGKSGGYVVDQDRGEVIVIDAPSEQHSIDEITQERGAFEVCEEPRGMVESADGKLLHIACECGDLVTLNTSDMSENRRLHLGGDLHDVQIFEEGLAVTRFRRAEILIINAEGEVTNRLVPPHDESFGHASVAWRMLVRDEKIYLLFQYASETPLGGSSRGYYGNGCSFQVVLPTVSVFYRGPKGDLADGESSGEFPQGSAVVDGFWLQGMVHLQGASGVVDMALTGKSGVVVTVPGNAWAPVQRQHLIELSTVPSGVTTNSLACQPIGTRSQDEEERDQHDPFVAVAASMNGFVGQTAHHANIKHSAGTTLSLAEGGRISEGSRAFHMSTDAGIACVSCHPGGSDDGHTWSFVEFGKRRTQSLGGGMKERKSFHWDGSLETFDSLMGEVFVRRMGLAEIPDQETQDDLLDFLDGLPASARGEVADLELLNQGRELFESAEVGCIDCHSGSRLSDGEIYDVGTGGKFVTPSLLGVASRAPYMHDGCAKDLEARFGACGGGDAHGVTSHLSEDEVQALVAFLKAQ